MRRILVLVMAALPLAAQSELAPTPPMGWNSWDSYGLSITEAEFRANTEVLARKLKPFGWLYSVVDEGWYLPNPEAKAGEFKFILDANGRYTPAASRFPSASGGEGFKRLADYVHSRGLRFGLHIIRGIPREAVAKNSPIADSNFRAADAADISDTCPWNADNYGVKDTPAGQAYYDSVARLYANWEVDFVKIDCIASHPYKGDEIRMFSAALKRCGRPIILSLSPGPAPLDKLDELRRYANMWRISDDFWDHWGRWPKHEFSQGALKQFATAAEWAQDVKPDHWPDADMLPLGYLGPRPGAGEARETKLTHDEQQTVMTLWSVFRSPLIMGGNLTRLDEFTMTLLTNGEIVAADQHSTNARVVVSNASRAVWTARPDTGAGYYVALFNLSDQPSKLRYGWKDLGLAEARYTLRDLWSHKETPATSRIEVTIQPHGSAFYRLTDSQ
ncbi:MAG: glycoside hydrolase family 27 protein [Acidobacteriaceae bacterium]|nr:glycoside hydrolase family 27 protein [Acidobacteriaceae bacterium]